MDHLSTWNIAVLVDVIARDTPDREAVVYGARRITWHGLASRVRSFAWHLHNEGGLARGDRIVIALPNCPAYFETLLATRKLHCVPLNVGTGLSVDTLHRIVDGSDAKVVVCSAAQAQVSHDAIRRIPKRWRPAVVEVGEQYETAIAAAVVPAEWDIETPSADDLVFLANYGISSRSSEFGPTVLPAAPLALGNTLAVVLRALAGIGRVILVDSVGFDPEAVWRAVERERVEILTIGGDEFARPLLAALRSTNRVGSLTALRTISSSGNRLSPDVARALETTIPRVTILDAYEEPAQQAPGATPRVHPSDVEAGLCKHPSVADCVVIGVSDPRIGKQVVAVIQVSEGHYLDASEIAAWCRAHLPSTLTPGRFVFVEKILRSESGDADYQALRAAALDRLVGDR